MNLYPLRPNKNNKLSRAVKQKATTVDEEMGKKQWGYKIMQLLSKAVP